MLQLDVKFSASNTTAKWDDRPKDSIT